MALFDQLTGMISGATRGGVNPATAGFMKYLNQLDFTWIDSGAVTSAYTAGQFSKIGSYTVPAQQAYTWGYGVPVSGGQQNQGFIYFLPKDNSSAPLTGSVRFAVADANELNIQIVAELRTDNLAGSQTLSTQQIPFPKQGREAKFNDKLIIYLKVDTAPSYQLFVSRTNSVWTLPTTLRAPA